MTNAEQTLQATLLEAADEIAPGSIPALRLDKRPTARFVGSARRAAAPIAAALAVLAVVGGLIMVGHLTSAPARHTPAAPAAAGTGTPSLYVTLSIQGQPPQVLAEAHASRTGQILSKVQVGTAGTDSWITADRSGRAYVIDAGARDGATTLYLLRVSGNGRSATVTKLPINLTRPTPDEVVDGLALSPDGSKLAVALQHVAGTGLRSLTGTIRVYQMAGGAPQTWAAPGDPGLPFSPAWTDPGQLTFVWQDHLMGTGSFYTGRSQIRVLDTSGPGRNLLSSRVLVTGGGRLGFIQSALAGPGDVPVIAATFRVSPPGAASGTANLRLAELSAKGAVMRVLARSTFTYSGHTQEGLVVARCQVAAIDATGQHALAYCPSFGRIDRGRFTPLPHNAGDFAAAW